RWSPALPWARSEASPLILASHAPRRTAGRERRGSRAAFKPGARQEDGPDPLLRNGAGPSAAGCQRPRMALRLGRARIGSTPLGIDCRMERCSAVMRLLTWEDSALVRTFFIRCM